MFYYIIRGFKEIKGRLTNRELEAKYKDLEKLSLKEPKESERMENDITLKIVPIGMNRKVRGVDGKREKG